MEAILVHVNDTQGLILDGNGISPLCAWTYQVFHIKLFALK